MNRIIARPAGYSQLMARDGTLEKLLEARRGLGAHERRCRRPRERANPVGGNGQARRLARRLGSAYIRTTLPTLRLFSKVYLRAEVRGLRNIPAEGPVLLVGNHSGGTLISDTFVFAQAFYDHFGPLRRFHQLAHDLVFQLPGARASLSRFGTVPASPENMGRRSSATPRCSSTRAATTRPTARAGSPRRSTSPGRTGFVKARHRARRADRAGGGDRRRRPRSSSARAAASRGCCGWTGCCASRCFPRRWAAVRRDDPRPARPHPAAGEDHGPCAAQDRPEAAARAKTPTSTRPTSSSPDKMQKALDDLAEDRSLPCGTARGGRGPEAAPHAPMPSPREHAGEPALRAARVEAARGGERVGVPPVSRLGQRDLPAHQQVVDHHQRALGELRLRQLDGARTRPCWRPRTAGRTGRRGDRLERVPLDDLDPIGHAAALEVGARLRRRSGSRSSVTTRPARAARPCEVE